MGIHFRFFRRASLPAVLLIGTALHGCVADSTGPGEKWIGSAGGTVSLADGAVSLSIPAGALSGELWFTATRTSLVPSGEFLVSGTTYDIGPPGTSFSVPVTLTLAYEAANLPTGIGEEGLALFRVGGGVWSLMPNSSVNTRARTVSGEVSSLGRFGVMGLSVASVEVLPSSASMEPGDSLRVTATPRASDQRPLTSRPVEWSSSAPDVVAVSDSGWVKALAEGSATVTATSVGQSGTTTVWVSIPVASVEVAPSDTSLALGQTLQLQATPKEAGGNALSGRTVVWSTSNAAVATVESSGLVTAGGVGTATITGSVGGISGSATVTVQAELVVLTSTLAGGVVGESYSQVLAATGGNGTYSWTVTEGSLPGGLDLDPATGVIQGIPTRSETSTFTVRVESGGRTGDRALAIAVSPVPVASVDVAPSRASLTLGDSLQLSAMARDASGTVLSGRAVTWISDDTDVVTVSDSGLVRPAGEGSALVTANVEGFTDWSQITVLSRLAVSTDTLSVGVVGSPFGDTLKAAGGDGSYTWSLAEDSLPQGLELDSSTGVISGSPAEAGTVTFTVHVASGDGQTATKELSLIVYDELAIASGVLETAVVGASYADTLTAIGGDGVYSWSMDSDTLPTGLIMDPISGIISGVPTEAATYVFTVVVESGDGQSADRPILLTVSPEPVASVTVSPTSFSLTPGQSRVLVATPKDAAGNALEGRTVTWTSSSPGVATVDAGGVVTGVAIGSATITASSEGTSASATVTVHGPLTVATTSLAGGTVGTAYSQTLAAAGGNGSYSWSVISGALPAGLSLVPNTGVISGTPAGPGVSNFTVQVTSGDGQTATKALPISISTP